jgi:hypothetical protein
MKPRFERNGAAPVTTTQAGLASLMQVEFDKYWKVNKAADARLK